MKHIRLDIKEVSRCKNGASGNFILRRSGKAIITISRKLNDTVAEYAATVLHELLHLWMTMLRFKGIRVTNTLEHKFIYGVEDAVIGEFRKHLKGKI